MTEPFAATATTTTTTTTTAEDDDDNNGDTNDNDPYLKMIQFESIRNSYGLEKGISVQWHTNMKKPLQISTLLQPQDLAPLFDGAQWAGTRVWHAAIAAIHYLVSTSTITSSTRILELGAGLGVPGMVLHSLYKCPVLLTDQESIISQLQQNVQDNFTCTLDTDNIRIQARPLSWSQDAIALLLKREQEDFDIVLNCDCVYEPLYGDSWKRLVVCMEELLRKNPSTLMVTSVERRASDGVDSFLETLRQSPLVSSVDCVFEDTDYRLEIYVARGNIIL
jgi:predicted nicotinamide N-methyase